MGFLIGFYTEGLEIGAKSLEEQSIGGSESAFIYMARELAKLGNEIKVFCNLDQRYANIKRDEYGIDWYDKNELPDLGLMYKFDIFICYRFYNIFGSHNLNSNLNILVNHDVLTDHKTFMTYAWQIDHIFNLSKYHCDNYTEKLPELKDFIWKTKNGVDLDKINSISWPEKRENRLVYASRPERGLERLLLMWDNGLRDILPDYELAICGYDLGRDIWATLHPKQREYYKNLDVIVSNMKGVKKYGTFTKDEYFSLLKGSKAMVYPTSFPEISCINALESMACGTPIISTDAFALSETIGDKGILIGGNPDSEEYRNDFAAKLKNLLSNHNQWKEYSYRGKQWVVNSYQWKDIAKSWMDKFEELLDTRFTRNKGKVLDQLIHNSDIIAANKIAKENMLESYVEYTSALLEKTKYFKEEYNSDVGYIILESKKDYPKNHRFGHVIDFIEESKAKNILDIGCHVGSFAISLSNILPDIKVTGVDISEECIEVANTLKEKFAKSKDNITFMNWDCRNAIAIESEYDFVFAGEILEHIVDINSFIGKLERTVKLDGYVYFTVPSGPWESVHFDNNPGADRFHISHFEMQDLKELFEKKKNFKIQYVPSQLSFRGELVGWWFISYQKSDSKTGEISYSKKVYTRPYQFISCGLITYNEENNISKCLKSVKNIVDEIVVCDTGSKDDTLKIVEKFTDRLYNISRDPDGDGLFNFAWARNETLSRASKKADWFLWLDADEELISQERLRRYLNSPIYEGYVLQQCVVGDTLISIAGGVEKIENLVGKRDFHVWAYSEKEKRMVLRKCLKVVKTGKKNIIEIKFNNGFLKCTPEHKIMLRGGNYKKAINLVPGDILMPFYRWVTSGGKKKDYWLVNLNDGNYPCSEHRYIYSQLQGEIPKNYHIHHIDNNRLNNYPENFKCISISEHSSITTKEMWKNEERKIAIAQKISETAQNNQWKDKQYDVDELLDAITKSKGRIYHAAQLLNIGYNCLREKMLDNGITTEMIYKEYPNRKNGNNNSNYKNIDSDKLIDAVVRFKGNLTYVSLSLGIPAGLVRRKLEEYGISQKVKEEFPKIYRDLKVKKELNKISLQRHGVYNHIVESVNKCKELANVYDMEVEDCHNFVANGVVVHNCHLILDMKDVKPDTPVRIFKTGRGYKFYGVVHEQSQKSLNDQIHPSLIIPYTKLLHYGYTTEFVRRMKCSKRNIALLLKDRRVNPDRQINLCLLMRDYFNSANWEVEAESGVNEKATIFLRTACDIWEQEFKYNKEHPYYGLAFPLYQQVLEKMGQYGIPVKDKGNLPLTISLSLAGAVGQLSGKEYKPQVYWFKDSDEYKDWMAYKSNELIEKINYHPKNGGN